jgi:hypothetical protein
MVIYGWSWKLLLEEAEKNDEENEKEIKKGRVDFLSM